MKLTKHYANEGWFKQLFILILLICFAPVFTVNAQRIFDIDNPAGTYIITDYLNNKITLKIGKIERRDIVGETYGRGSATVNGRTLIGNWHLTECNNQYFLAFHTYDNVNMKYSLPSGTIKCDQIMIAEDGRVSYNSIELQKTNSRDYIKARRATATKSGAKKSKKRK